MPRNCARLSLAIYAKAAAHALERGLILARYQVRVWADSKGHCTGGRGVDTRLVSILAQRRLPPRSAAAVVRQTVVRDYLETVGWNKQPPAPELPANVVRQTQEKYEQALHLLTGPAI